MYNFIDLNEEPKKEAPSVSCTIGGYNLDSQPGFTTLNVEGLDDYEGKVNELNTDGMDGAHFKGINLPPRDIGVEVLLSDPTDVKTKYDALKENIVTKKPVWCQFAHYPGEEVRGIVTSIEADRPEKRKNAIAYVNIRCSDPFIYSLEKTAGATVPAEYKENKILGIKLTVSQAAEFLTIENKNRNRLIRINFSVKAGDVIEYDFVNETITLNYTDVTQWIDFKTSYFHDFDANGGDTITSSNATINEITYRGRRV